MHPEGWQADRRGKPTGPSTPTPRSVNEMEDLEWKLAWPSVDGDLKQCGT